MQISVASLRTRIAAILFIITAVFSTDSFAFTTKTLTRNTWSLISIPADSASTGTVRALLADDLRPLSRTHNTFAHPKMT